VIIPTRIKILLPVVLLGFALISACSSSQTTNADEQSKKRKAAVANTSLGLEYMNRGQYEVALGKLKKAVAEDPAYAPGHTVLAVLYEQLGETELAGKHYKKAIQADSRNGDVNNNYGVYLCNTNESKRAMGHFLKALDDPFYSSPAVALTNAGSCALGTGEMAAADDYLRRALKHDPEFPDALFTMSKLNFIQQDFLKSRAFLQRYEAVGPQNAENVFLGYQIESALRNDKAAKRYSAILNSTYPGSEEAAEARRMSGQ